MKFGLEHHIIDKLIAVFEKYPKVDKALLFGSRAKGNYRPDSDIDIAIKGYDLNTDDIIAISIAFEEKDITHKIDLLNYDTIKEPDLKEHIDRVGVKFYSRWKEFELGDVINLKRGYDLPNAVRIKGEIPVISSSGITDYHNVPMKCGPGVITGRYGTIGQVFYTDKPYWPLNTTLYVQDFKKNHPKFIFYFLKGLDFEKYSDKSAVPGVNRNEVHKERILFPPIAEQTAIASILSSIDDKIDLLQRQNKTLEQLADTLFRQWFLEEAEIEFQMLKNFVDVIDNRGKTPPFSGIKTDFPIVEVKSLSNNDRFVNYEACEKYVNEETYKNWFRKGHPIKNDILISTVGSIGEMAFVIENKGGIAQNVVGLRAKNISPFYLYQFLSLPKTRREIKDLDIGAVQPSVKVPHLLDIEVPIPKDKNLILEFEKQLIPMFEKMKVNHFQIRTLIQTRDTLLPKLMSGEIRVTELHEEFS